MKSFSTTYLLFILCFILDTQVNAQRSNCSISPYEGNHEQPDGTLLTLKAYGTEAIHYFETPEGYTVLKNNKGFYEYATEDVHGNLTTSGIIAHNGQHFKAVKQHLRYSTTQQKMLMDYFNQVNNATQDMGKAGANPFPSSGVRKLLVILVEYPDLRSVYPQENFELLLNQPNYNGTGSFRDFYLATSNGKLEVNSTVYGWVMADSSYIYYGNKSSPNYNQATRRLLLGALKDAKDSFNIDFSEFDSDSDSYVDGVILMFAGIGGEENTTVAGNHIWSHRWSLPTSMEPTYDGVKVSAYAMFPERRSDMMGYKMVGIGVMCHEFGHLLDLPDLYSTQSTNSGAGNYSLMAGGNWLNSERTPCFADAWSRISMGWVTPTIINSQKEYTLNRFVSDSDMVYKISTAQSNEYFLLENRQRKGFDRFINSKGLAIWHINTNSARVLSQGFGNNVNNDTSQLGVGLIQADGLRQMELNVNRGDATDLYPLINNNSFGPMTKPASNLHYTVNNVRQPSFISILDIIQNADSSITFGFKATGTSSFNSSKVSGCIPLKIDFTNNSVGAETYLWDFGNNTHSADTNTSITYDSAGVYTVKLITFFAGTAVDTSERTITAYKGPDISYTYKYLDTAYGVSFTNTTKSISAFQWLFNNKVTSSSTNPTVTLDGPGLLYILATAYGSSGCITVKPDTIRIFNLGLGDNAAQQMNLSTFPNPFDSRLTVSFKLSKKGTAEIEVYNILGSLVHRTTSENLSAGNHEMPLETQRLGKGIYLLKVTADNNQGWLKIIRQ